MKKIGLMFLTAIIFVACGSSSENTSNNTTPSDTNNNGTLAQETMEKLQGAWSGTCEVDGNSSELMILTISNLNIETKWKTFKNQECNSTVSSELVLRGELSIGTQTKGLKGEDAIEIDTLLTGFTQKGNTPLLSAFELGIGEKTYGALMFKGENQMISADESTGRDGKTAEKRELDFSNGEVLTKVML